MSNLIRQVRQNIIRFASSHPDIIAVLLVGSYARHEERPDSDIDLIVLTDRKQQMIEQTDWTEEFGSTDRKTREEYGEITSIRAEYSNCEIEFGIGLEKWIAIPLDPGTREVLQDGYEVIYDRNGKLNRVKAELQNGRSA
ncbi:MAG: nucleotidyltransferase domain-containing protein [Candidatus Competibacteraceae bacterium]|nr:nucleotidyltransferase domain-containing protein [Candidatus Competibacteraceae bacterium]